MMINTYFNAIDYLQALKMRKCRKLQYFLSLLYFPFIITTFIICISNSQDYLWSTSNLFILSLLLVSAPILMVPSFYFIQGKNFILYRLISKQISKSDGSFKPFSTFLENEVSIPYVTNRKICGDFIKVLLKSKTGNNNVPDKIIYKPKKIITKYSKAKLEKFYNEKARNYFEIMDYSLQNFISLLSGTKEITFENSIELFNDCTNIELAAMVTELHRSTGITKKQISLLFKKKSKRNKEMKFLNYDSVKSSDSQQNKILKS